MNSLINAHAGRQKLISEVESILSSATNGYLSKTKETQNIDFKEEAGRRRGSQIEPGDTTNPQAADHLSNEVACFANSPGGGAIIVGVEDKTGMIIGTQIDIDWLRQGINSRIDVAPEIVERHVEGQRLLVIYVAPTTTEPVYDLGNSLRWRVGDHCVPVDRTEWWNYRKDIWNIDEMAQASTVSIDQVRPAAMQLVREYLNERGDSSHTNEEILHQSGAVGADQKLTIAGALLLTAQDNSLINLTSFDVHGGNVTFSFKGKPGTSVLEQLSEMELVLKTLIKEETIVQGFVHKPIPQIPYEAVREALLNAMIHRDWFRSEPVEVRWIELDSTLIVRSPGGFPPAINSNNVLSNRSARYPALADLYRAFGLVDKQGVGVDRMYQSMITLGHEPPLINEVSGPYVETTLVGGSPVPSVLTLVSSIVPEARQRDYRIAIVLHLLQRRAFITEQILATGLQSNIESARHTLSAACQTTVRGEALVMKYREVWVFGHTSKNILKKGNQLGYLTTDSDVLEEVAMDWLKNVGDIATSDLMLLCGVSRTTAKKNLEKLISEQRITEIGGGRSRKYRLIS